MTAVIDPPPDSPIVERNYLKTAISGVGLRDAQAQAAWPTLGMLRSETNRAGFWYFVKCRSRPIKRLSDVSG